MPKTPIDGPIAWRLRELMAAAGMFQTTDLVEPLREAGVQLSREQVFRLVTKPPARLNMEVLAALCAILKCSPNDLIEVRSIASAQIRRASAGGRTDNTTASADLSIGNLRPVPARIHRPDTGR